MAESDPEQVQPEPWDRQLDESPPAFDAFVVYRDQKMTLGRRSQRQVAVRVGKHRRNIEKWAQRHAWVKRSLAWDDHLDDVRKGEILGNVRETTARLLQMGLGGAAQAFTPLVNRIKTNEMSDASLVAAFTAFSRTAAVALNTTAVVALAPAVDDEARRDYDEVLHNLRKAIAVLPDDSG